MPPGASLQGDPISLSKNSVERNPSSWGGGARGGGSPPRMESNALNALPGKAFSERSEDFSAAQAAGKYRHFAGCRKSLWTFSTAWWARRQARP